MTRHLSSLLAAAALAPAALAQVPTTTDTTVTYALTWDDVGPGGGAHNGDVEPGESVLFRITASFTNQNSVGVFTPPLAGFSSGTIRGLSSAFLDLVGGFTAQGVWDVSPAHGYGVTPPWNIAGSGGNGVPAAGGTQLTQIQFGQFVAEPALINPTNPIVDVFSALWTPTSFAVRWETFQLAASAASNGYASAVLFQLSPTQLAAAYCPSNLGSVAVGIGIPAPGSALILTLGLAAAARRRRTPPRARA